MRRPQFLNDEIYHIYNRGVEKRKIFMEDRDYLRFIHDLFEFNDKAASLPPNVKYSTRKPSEVKQQCLEVRLRNITTSTKRKPRKLLVEILCFCLMPNHYHLLVKQLTKGGITKFMRKLGVGYTNYFNLKRDRVGPLFQGKFKAVAMTEDSQFLYIPHYIHLNPLELITPGWKEEGLKNHKKAMNFLENYRWSSFPDYVGKKNFPSVTQREFLIDCIGEPKDHKSSAEEWLKEENLTDVKDLLLD